MLPLVPSVTGHHESLTVYYWKYMVRVQQSTVHVCFESLSQDSKQMRTVDLPCTFSNTRSKTRGAWSQMESKGALEYHPFD